MTEQERSDLWLRDRELIKGMVFSITELMAKLQARLTTQFEEEIKKREEKGRQWRTKRVVEMEGVVNAILIRAADPDTYRFVKFTSTPRMKCQSFVCKGKNTAVWVLKRGGRGVELFCESCREGYPERQVEHFATSAAEGAWYMFPNPRKKTKKGQ
jgi:hypothetical protein